MYIFVLFNDNFTEILWTSAAFELGNVGDEGDLVDQLTNTTANQSIFCVQIAVERL